MTTQDRIRAEVERMAGQPGIERCALVEAATGFVWHASRAGDHAERVWEAAVDYWRLYERQKEQFAVLGPLGAVAMHHVAGVRKEGAFVYFVLDKAKSNLALARRKAQDVERELAI